MKVTDGPWKGVFGVIRDIDQPRPGADPVVIVETPILGTPTMIRVQYWQVNQL